MAGSENKLMRLDETHVESAAATLAQAFHNYPVFTYVFPDAAERKEESPNLFQSMVHYGLLHGEVYATSPGMEGVAVWLPPGFPGGFAETPAIGEEASERFAHFGGWVYTTRQEHAPSRHWFLELIGVTPEFQGKGYASRLLEPILDKIVGENLPCYLDTEVDTNVALYQRFGFRVVHEMIVPDTGVRSWGMLKA